MVITLWFSYSQQTTCTENEMYLLFVENYSYFYQKVWTKFMQLYLFNMSPNVAFTWQHFSLILFCIFSNENWWQVLDHGLCYSTSKPIGDEEHTLNSFMAFNITAHGPVFRAVVESWIVFSSNKKKIAQLQVVISSCCLLHD